MSLILRFSGSFNLAALAVKVYTKSWCSHVETIIDESSQKRLYGAHPKTGVNYRSIKTTEGDRVEDYELCIPKVKRIIYMQKILSQRNKPYDYGAIIDMVLSKDRDWKDESAWFCSELVVWALIEAGLPPLRTEHLNRITPRDLLLSPYLKRIDW